MPRQQAPARLTPDPGPPGAEDAAPLRAAHTPNFPTPLRQLGMAWGAEGQFREGGGRCGTYFSNFTFAKSCLLGYTNSKISPDLPQLPLPASGTIGLICCRGHPPQAGRRALVPCLLVHLQTLTEPEFS